MKKVMFTLVVTICVVFLCNVKSGFTQEQMGMEKRMDYLESRLSEIATIQGDYGGMLEEQGSIVHSLKGLMDRVSVGVGMRTKFTTTEDAAGTKAVSSGGRSWDKDFNLDSMRIYLGAKITDNITVEINTDVHERDIFDDNIKVLDAFVEFKWNDYFHIRAGRHLPASDRYNLDGPYYNNSFNFPLISQRWPNVALGRVDGISYWGQYKGGKFKWQGSVSEGREISEAANDDYDHLQFSGRLTYNFWEPESGYYNSSTYYGKKDVLAIGLVGWHQSDGTGTAESGHDFNGWNVDFRCEKNFGWGTIDVEAAYFDYGMHGGRDSELLRATTLAGPVSSDGTSWTAGFSYLYPEKIGWGQPQFVSRYQSFNPTGNQTAEMRVESKLELGLHYIIEGHNAKIALVYSNEHIGGTTNEDRGAVLLGMQFQH